MNGYRVKTLSSRTWGAFAELCPRNNGAGMGGCWCCWFHNATKAEKVAAGSDDWRGYKERLVREGTAHAALMFDGEGKEYPSSFLVNVTRPMFEQADFTYVKAIGKNNCVMRKVV